MAATCLVAAWVHCANLPELFWVVVWNVCWYLSLKWTAGYDRKGGSLTSFKCHYTKRMQHIAAESSHACCLFFWFFFPLLRGGNTPHFVRLNTRHVGHPDTTLVLSALNSEASFTIRSVIAGREQVLTSAAARNPNIHFWQDWSKCA